MREAIFILLVIAVLSGLTLYRYRRQIRMIREMWNAAKSLRNGGSDRPLTQKTSNEGQLVNCSACGVWVVEDRAIRVGKGSYYCSKDCLTEAKV